MSLLTDLYDKGSYPEVIMNKKAIENNEDRVCVLFSYMSLNEFDKALSFLLENKEEMYKELPELVIETHVSLLCGLYRFDDAYSISKQYQNMPYISQNVEEVLRELDKKIRESEIEYYRDSSVIKDDKINELLKSDKQEDVLGALSFVRDRGVEKFLPNILNILVNFKSQSVRSMFLTLLKELNYDKEVKFNSLGKIITVTPKDVINPMLDKDFKQKLELLEKYSNKDITVYQNAEKIFIQYSLAILPNNVKLDDELTFEAIVEIAKQYLYKNLTSNQKVKEKMFEIIKAIS